MIQICSGITSGRVFNGELYAQRLQKLIYLHLLTGWFMKISLQSSELFKYLVPRIEEKSFPITSTVKCCINYTTRCRLLNVERPTWIDIRH